MTQVVKYTHRIFIACILFCGIAIRAQAQHFIGIKEGLSFSTINSSQPLGQKAVTNRMNIGLVYKYYAGKWVGVQAGLNYAEKGYQLNDTSKHYQTIELPVVSQFHVELWKFRLLAQFGIYGAYALRANLEYADDNGNTQIAGYTFKSYENKLDCGTVFGAGFSMMLKPIEIQLEYNYHFGLIYLQNPRIPGPGRLFMSHNQSIVSIGILYAL